MVEKCQEKRDEVGDAIDDGLDMLPSPISGIAKILRRLGSLFWSRKAKARRAKIERQKAWEQAAGENRNASSAATTARASGEE